LLDAVVREPERVRVLLLARQVGEWWQRLEGGGQAVRDLVADASRELIELTDAIVPGASAADVVLDALPWFAARLDITVAEVGLVRITRAEQARILDLHAAALVAVLDARERRRTAAVSIDVSTVLDVLLGHEKRYWQDSARSLKLFDVAGGFSAGQLSQVAAAMCLLGAASEDEAAGLSGRVSGGCAVNDGSAVAPRPLSAGYRRLVARVAASGPARRTACHPRTRCLACPGPELPV